MEEDPDFESEMEEEKPSVIRKVFVIAVGLFLLFLFLSYFLVGPYAFDIVESMAVSSEMQGLVVEGDGFDVVFEEGAYNELKEVYYNNQGHEFKACLGGKLSGGTYLIESVLLPRVHHQEFSMVVSEMCPKEALVSMHSHPYRRCTASRQDFKSFESFRRLNPDAVMMIMCEEGRFYVYR